MAENAEKIERPTGVCTPHGVKLLALPA